MKRLIKRTIIIIIILALLCTAATIAIYHYTDNIGKELTVLPEQTSTADCIIVLGAGVYGNYPSTALANRLDKALEIYSLGHTEKIIVSGDHGSKSYDEVNVMRDYLVQRGVDINNVFMDHAGFSTYDSMYRAKEVFKAKRVIIVTQQLHLRRALYIAQSLGLECVGVEALNANAVSTRMQSIREYPARVKAFLQCEILHSKPKFLGDPIPVSGSGIATEG